MNEVPYAPMRAFQESVFRAIPPGMRRTVEKFIVTRLYRLTHLNEIAQTIEEELGFFRYGWGHEWDSKYNDNIEDHFQEVSRNTEFMFRHRRDP